MIKAFSKLLDRNDKAFNTVLMKVLAEQGNYIQNDLVAKFEKEYATKDFAAERRAKCITPELDKIYKRFGEEKGTNLCAALYTFLIYSIQEPECGINPDQYIIMWKEFCYEQVEKVLGSQGAADLSEASKLLEVPGDFVKEVNTLGDFEFLRMKWIVQFKNRIHFFKNHITT